METVEKTLENILKILRTDEKDPYLKLFRSFAFISKQEYQYTE
jgi:hypothetical protein